MNHRRPRSQTERARRSLETRLLAEEKSLIQAIKSVKAYKFRLQMERMELEFMKDELLKELKEQQPDLTTEPKITSAEIIEFG